MRVIECDQYSARWWEVRRGVPTASEFSNIITPARGEFSKSAVTYACKLIADRYDGNYGPQSEFATAAMRTGTVMEPEARRFYEFNRDCEVEQVGFVLTDDGRFGCSPDSLVGDDGVLELKSPKAETHVRYILDGKLPDEYKPQCHGLLIVTGRQWCDFMSYVPGFPKFLIRVEPDVFTDKLRDGLEKFWPLYQEMLSKVESQREEAIEEAITRRGAELADPDSLNALVPPSGVDVEW